jgi:hypothetical protein
VSALAEAVLLPAVFLTVVLIAGIKPGAAVSLVPPSLASLVAATALFGLLVRSGAVAPGRLVNPARTVLANLNGLSVLVTLFLASAQIVTALVPESGLPALIVWTVFAALLLQAFAIAPDRTRVLRGLLVTFGAAFTLKFVVLSAISSPAQGRMARALQLLFEGVTFGAVMQRPPGLAEGYLAFAATATYLLGVAFLPSASWEMIRVLTRAALPDNRRDDVETNEREAIDSSRPYEHHDGR